MQDGPAIWQGRPRCVRSRSERGGLPSEALGLGGGDVVLVAQRDADVVEAVEQPPPDVVVDLELHRDGLTGGEAVLLEVDGDLGTRLALEVLPERDDVL